MQILVIIFRFLFSFLIVGICLFLGNQIHKLGIALPGSIIGMILLYLGLSLKLIPEKRVSPFCSFMIKYMTLFFLPVSVGIINCFADIRSNFWALILSCLLSSIFIILVVGLIMEYYERKDNP